MANTFLLRCLYEMNKSSKLCNEIYLNFKADNQTLKIKHLINKAGCNWSIMNIELQICILIIKIKIMSAFLAKLISFQLHQHQQI